MVFAVRGGFSPTSLPPPMSIVTCSDSLTDVLGSLMDCGHRPSQFSVRLCYSLDFLTNCLHTIVIASWSKLGSILRRNNHNGMTLPSLRKSLATRVLQSHPKNKYTSVRLWSQWVVETCDVFSQTTKWLQWLLSWLPHKWKRRLSVTNLNLENNFANILTECSSHHQVPWWRLEHSVEMSTW